MSDIFTSYARETEAEAQRTNVRGAVTVKALCNTRTQSVIRSI